MSRWKQPYTLYKRGNYWYYRTYDAYGVRTHGISTGKTSKGAAKAFCDELFKNGLLSCNYQLTYSAFAEHFFDDDSLYIKEHTNLSTGSKKVYKTYNKIINDRLGKFRLTEINNTKVREFRTNLLSDGYSAKYISTVTTILNIVMEQAYNDMLIIRNPCVNLPAISDGTKNKDSFTLEEVRQLYQQTELKDLIILLALTGMRISEALGIRPVDVQNLSNVKYIKLTKQIDSKGLYVPLKTKKERYIPIITEIKPVEAILYENATVKLRPIIKALPDAKERKLTTHSLRHFFITNAKSYGINPLIVETIAGHSLKGMEGVYTNFKPDDLKPILEWQKEIYKKITE